MDTTKATLVHCPRTYRGFWNRIVNFEQQRTMAREYGVVMIYHRWIDGSLIKAVKSRFVENVGEPTRLLMKYPGGLSTFSARAHIGRCLGIYGPITYRDLKSINEIRNEFAHPKPDPESGGELEILGFEHETIKGLCDNLRFLKSTYIGKLYSKPMTAEETYCANAYFIATSLHFVGEAKVKSMILPEGPLP